MSNLTGRSRHRVLTRFLRTPVLVLQLEVEGIRIDYYGGYCDTETITWWVDADVTHLTQEENSESTSNTVG